MLTLTLTDTGYRFAGPGIAVNLPTHKGADVRAFLQGYTPTSILPGDWPVYSGTRPHASLLRRTVPSRRGSTFPSLLVAIVLWFVVVLAALGIHDIASPVGEAWTILGDLDVHSRGLGIETWLR